MEDKRIGRATHSEEVSAAVSTTITPLIGPDPNRVAIAFFASPDDGVWVTTRNDAAVKTGLFIPKNGTGIYLTIEDHGDIVRKGWSGSVATTPTAIGIVTGSLPLQ